MSINLGTAACAAAANLGNNADFRAFLDGLGDVAQTRVLAAGSVPPDMRVDATAHARGVYDVWVQATAAASPGVHAKQVKLPPVKTPVEK